MNPDTTPTPRTDACPHCGAGFKNHFGNFKTPFTRFECLSTDQRGIRTDLCREREARQKLERELAKKNNEVARLRELLNKATDLIADIMWDEVNPIDECEKFIRAHAPERLKRQLAPSPEEPVSEGTSIAAEARSACNDMTEEERKRYASLAEDVLKLHRPDNEPVIQDSRITEPVTKRLCNDCGQPHSKHTLHRYETICPEPSPDDLHAWMRIQEEINKEVAGELQSLRDEIQKLKEAR